jgi:hypothetical protein
VDFFIENLLKIKIVDHSKIQAWIKRYFYDLGYYSRTEKGVWRDRKGRIDVFAQKGDYTVGIEVDHGSIRLNSIEKLNALKPSLAVFVLKGRVFNWKKTYSRFKFLEVKSLIIHLRTGQYKWIYPEDKNFCRINENAPFYNKQDHRKCQSISSENLKEAKRPNHFGSEK